MPSFRIPPPEGEFLPGEESLFSTYDATTARVRPWLLAWGLTLYLLGGFFYLYSPVFRLPEWLVTLTLVELLLYGTWSLVRSGRHEDLTLTNHRLIRRVRGAGWAILELPLEEIRSWRLLPREEDEAQQLEVVRTSGRLYKIPLARGVAERLVPLLPPTAGSADLP